MSEKLEYNFDLEFYVNPEELEIPPKKRPKGLSPEAYADFVEAGLEMMKKNNVKIHRNTPVPVEFIIDN